MKRLIMGVLVACLLAGAVAFSRNQQPAADPGDLRTRVESRNPWTHLRLNNDPAEFQFAIVSDRTGGHRARVFSQAVEQLNLLQPEFVLSVGDLIEGYTEDQERLAAQWREFQGYAGRLQMPFFYVPGNHDVTNPTMERLWREKFGRHYYHVVYRGVLLLVLNSDDPPGQGGHVSEEQRAYVKQALEENPDVRWTVVALHKPLWSQGNADKTGWPEVEKLLGTRPYTVFAGHVHRYQKFVRNGRNYYQLATTGGGSRMRGVRYGEFDHFVWVTMKKDGPVLANVLLDGIYAEDMRRPVTDESGVASNRRPTHPVRGKVFFEGTPAPNAQVAFHLPDADGRRTSWVADALAEADGSFVLSTYAANDGAPVGEYIVTVTWRHPRADEQGRPGANWLPAAYASPQTSPLRFAVKQGANEVTLELTK